MTVGARVELGPVVSEGIALIEQLRGSIGSVRLMGSCAIAHRCAGNLAIWSAGARKPVTDIDVAVRRPYLSEVAREMKRLRYRRDQAMIRDAARYERLYFFPPDGDTLIEVFPTPLLLHHTIRVSPWDTSEQVSLPLTELFLTKIQYACLAHEDVLDLAVIFLEHSRPSVVLERLSFGRIADAARRDWGLYNTMRQNMALMASAIRKLDSGETYELILPTIREIQKTIDGAPKTGLWQLRSSIHTVCPCIRSGRLLEDDGREDCLDRAAS